MKICIITGPRRINYQDEQLVRAVVREIIARGYTIYACDANGVDEVAWTVAREESDRCSIGLYERFCPRPELGRTAQGLAERSTRMVKEALRDTRFDNDGNEFCDVDPDGVICIGFPNKPCPAGIVPAKSWRSGNDEGSGTWSTIALCVGHEIETWVIPLVPKPGKFSEKSWAGPFHEWRDIAPWGSLQWNCFTSDYCAWHFAPALQRDIFTDAGHEALVSAMRGPLPTYEESLKFFQK